MKFSVSVPDELWEAVERDGGPSETVQAALRALLDVQRAASRPLANAPDQANLQQYRPAFDEAVNQAVSKLRLALDQGYQLGLELAPGMGTSDFDLLDGPQALEGLHDLFSEWVENPFSDALNNRATEVVWSGRRGDSPGIHERFVQWHRYVENPGELDLQRWDGEYMTGVLAALRDVRDEALRQIKPREGDGQ
jgi:hypothetical protein